MDYSIQDDGSLTATFMDGGKYAYGKQMNLRDFYTELGKTLTESGWDDITWDKDPKFFSNVNATSKLKKGELADTKQLKRNKNMYEQKFFWCDKGDGAFDVEIIWKAKKKGSLYGDESVVAFELNLSNRNMRNVEILDGNNKITLQDGGWELRNKMEYKNVVLREKFKKLQYITKWTPFSEEYLKEIMSKMWFEKNVDHEIEVMKRKCYDKIKGIIDKHFK